MGCSFGGEGPAILQLHKWGPSQVQLNLSEFREAYISPRRELLSLLSYQCEVLLLPLITGDSIHCNHPENIQYPSSLVSCSASWTEPSRLDLTKSMSCNSGSVMVEPEDNSPLATNVSRSNNYPFLCDVTSLAWGVCGDTYNQHKDAAFRELLFVSGNRGVTVHAFCRPDKSIERTEPTLDGKCEQGLWVEWGPSATVAHNREVQEHFGVPCDAPKLVFDVDTIDGARESLHKFYGKGGDDELIRNSTSKRWLQTFLTKVETMEYNGNTWTRFPDKQSFPCSAKVVSFSIFDSNSLMLDFVSRANSMSGKEDARNESVPDPLNHTQPRPPSSTSSLQPKSDILSKFLDVGMSNPYKCARVFSSSSHHLIGFVLTLVDATVNSSDVTEANLSKFLIVVARLDSWGIQWLCSVKLEGSLNMDMVIEWTDFQFSEDLLVCLKASGSVFFYGAMTGEYVKHLDILQISGLYSLSNLREPDQLSSEGDLALRRADIHVDDEVHGKSTYQTGSRRMFKKLIVAPGTSLIAAVDEYGVVYVVCAGDHLPEKYYSFKKLIPQYQHLELGIFVGWEVGGFGIGQKSVFSNLSDSNFLSIRNGGLPSYDDNENNELQKMQGRNFFGEGAQQDLGLSGYCAASQKIDQRLASCNLPSHFMRKVFLPTDRYSEDDFLCFTPLGITRLVKKETILGKRSFQIEHSRLRVNSAVHDDRCLNSGFDLFNLRGREEIIVGDTVGCSFQGFFYLVTQVGLSVVLPSISVSSSFLPVESVGYRQPRIGAGIRHQGGDIFEKKESQQPWSPWKIEILDRVLLYEGPEEADLICMENGWDLKASRMRRLQLALDYLKFDEIEKSLEMLVGIDLAEEGLLRLLFAVSYLMFHKGGNDSEVSAASRLLALASCFAIKMIRKYGLVQHKKNAFTLESIKVSEIYPLPPVFPDKKQNSKEISRKLREMAYFLEIIRNLQSRLSIRFRRPGQELLDDGKAVNLMDTDLTPDDSHLAILATDAMSLDTPNKHRPTLPVAALGFNKAEKLALMPIESLDKDQLDSYNFSELSAVVSQGEFLEKKVLPLENPKDMIARWGMDNMDLKTIVKDAILSGRLPLAVLQLHLHRLKDLVTDEEPHDTFSEVRDVGRAIAYDLFLKGETELAVATLQRLGEDIETSLKQLVFGTLRKSLRVQIAKEMKRYGYLGSYEWNLLERIALIERLYPGSSFRRIFLARQNDILGVSSSKNSLRDLDLCILNVRLFNNLLIECGEVDGVVLGSWTDVNDSSVHVVDDDNSYGGYWVAAALWSDAWDQRTFDRIVLDQPSVIGVHLMWESQLEYHICHNNWEEVSKLLDMIPSSLLSDGSLQIGLDGLQSISTDGSSREFLDHGNYICSVEELDVGSFDVPNIKLLKISSNNASFWLRMLMEQKLSKKFIFLKENWEGTAEIIPLLAHSCFITGGYKNSFADEARSSSDLNFSYIDGAFQEDTVQALHKLVVRHCAQYNLPNLLDLYLDNNKLILDDDLLFSSLEAAGDCHWAKWLLLSKIKGRAYDASFFNSRAIMSRNPVHGNDLSALEIDERICTVDDIAEGGGEMAALATLMYAPLPIQNCLSSGSVNRHCNSSAQCTLENLRHILQRFRTLWQTLVAACFGQDTSCNYLGLKAKHVIGNSALSDYLNWRDNIFFSTGRDTALLQMLPCWFPKAVRRLVQLYVQGPLGWQSLAGLPIEESFLNRGIDFVIKASEHTEISAMSWEAAIQKRVEEELYDSSLKESGIRIEHHLHRGRPLAAFNHLLGARVQKLKSENGYKGQANTSAPGQNNVQSDVQTLLEPVAQNEVPFLSSVMPLAIMHFEDSPLVASCAFLLELCGLSARMLRVDITALKRISSFFKSSQYDEYYKQLLPKGSAFHALSHEGDIADSLAQALADDYLHRNTADIVKHKESQDSISGTQSSHALMLVLQHLEKASLPLMAEGKTCGFWLSCDSGDGTELRSQQIAASQHWDLVNVFCQMHQIPLSTKYLAVLARDNDWVGFLSEAQIGRYPFETVFQVASKDFSDPRLKVHILTVLKGMQSKKMAISTSNSDSSDRQIKTSFTDKNLFLPVELFGILAECEKQKNPGEALLIKAKDLSWSILALVASCFPDVSPLSCLTVWLEITAARETSSIKVNGIASQIAKSVGAAVEVTNSLPAGCRAIIFHYNRRNPKRRRLIEPTVDPLVGPISEFSSTSGGERIFMAQSILSEEKRKTLAGEDTKDSIDSHEGPASLSKMVAVLCEQHLFLPLLRAFEMFLPSCSLLPFIRALQAFSHMRLSEASAHLGSFSARIKEEPTHLHSTIGREDQIGMSWISSTAVKAADAMLSTCPSPYEKRCLLQLLAAIDFGDGGSAATYYRRLYWKINLAEPSLRRDIGLHLGNETLDDASLLTALEKNGHWEQARNWARQLETSSGPWKSSVHHVTETQAESMVAEWKEFLWDVPEERVALWSHCQTLFIRYSFPALQAGLFFLKHAEAVEKDLPARELHELLMLSLQWLTGMITQSTPVYPLHLLREIETRVWLLAVESEAQAKSDGDFISTNSRQHLVIGNSSNIVDRTASAITKMDNHINAMRNKTVEKNDSRETNQTYLKNPQVFDTGLSATAGGSTKTKRRAKGYLPSRRLLMDPVEKPTDTEDNSRHPCLRNDLQSQDENLKIEVSFSRWEERVEPAELERAVLSLLEFGQITAAKQLQNKLSPANSPFEFVLVDVALKLAAMSTPCRELSVSMLDEEVKSVMQSYDKLVDQHLIYPLQVLESLAIIFTEGSGRGLCKRIIAVVNAANVLGLSFSEAFSKQPIEVLQLLSLKAQDSFEEAKLIVQFHSMPAASIAQILAESFLKGLLAAHRGGYMDSQKEEGPAPLLWRFSDFLKWAELCPSEPEIGHALMRLVITGQEIPHACEVELLILSHHFYKSSACLDGVDVLVALAATRVEAYVSEGDFPCLARLITGVGNFHALNFILGILIENGQLDLLLQKYSAAADTNTGTAEAVRGFRMAVLTSLKHFNPNDLDAFAMVYNHFDMKHETASLLESRANQSYQHWFLRYDRDQNEDLLESMRYYIEAAEVHSSIDAGNKTHNACAQASLVSLQIRMPDFQWLGLSETNARRALVEQSRFQEALIVAEAYNLNQPSEWALVLWNQMLKPELTEQFVAEFVAVLPLQPSMLADLAKFYRAEVAARGDQSQFSVWLTGGGLPAEWAKYLGRSFRCLLKRTRDLRLRMQLATVATGFVDVIDACLKTLDKVPDTAGPLVLRKGHGGAYLPLM